MKMLNNVLGADVFAISRTPIQSPQSTKMGEGDLRCAARPSEPPAQVHPDHHAEDGAVAVAEHVDGVDAREQKKDIKNSCLPPTVLVPCVAVADTRWLLGANANAPRLDDHHVDVGSRVGRHRSSWMSKRLQVVDEPGYVEDSFQSRHKGRQTTGGQL